MGQLDALCGIYNLIFMVCLSVLGLTVAAPMDIILQSNPARSSFSAFGYAMNDETVAHESYSSL